MRRLARTGSDAGPTNPPVDASTTKQHVRVRLNKYTLQFTDPELERGFQARVVARCGSDSRAQLLQCFRAQCQRGCWLTNVWYCVCDVLSVPYHGNPGND